VWGAVLRRAGFREASPLVFTVFLQHDLEGGRAAREALQPALPIARRVVLAFAALAAVGFFLAARSALPGAWGWLTAALGLVLLLASPIVRSTVGDVPGDCGSVRSHAGLQRPGMVVATRHSAPAWRGLRFRKNSRGGRNPS